MINIVLLAYQQNRKFSNIVSVIEMLTVGNTKLKVRGIFAQKRFLKGEIVEISPVVVIPSEQVSLIDQTVLTNYYYDWENGAVAIAYSLVSIINDSYHPNTYYVKKFANK
mgnify:CR=1 FL=1